MGYANFELKDRETDNEKFNRYMKRAAKIGAVVIPLALVGYAGDHLGRERFVDVDETQKQELISANQSALTRISRMSFDETGLAQKAMDDPAKPGFKNSLTVQLRQEGETFIY